VNVSALQLLRGDFPGLVGRVLEETGLPPASLELELTESVVMSNAPQSADKLRALRDLGVSLAIDDFGTGYSSLAYLRRLPFTTLKIDKEFVDDLSHDTETEDAAITTTVLAMARSLGLKVVAEGVETEAQLQFLRDHRCDEIQGFWLAPPLEAAECPAFIRRWRPTTGRSSLEADLAPAGGAARRTPSAPRRVRPRPPADRARKANDALIAQLQAVAARVDALAARTQQLAEENRSLRQQQEQLAGERSQLLARNEQARSRVEAMIARLKSLEQHT
jgi:uncharacterized protein (TIGR02449 family)